MAYLSPSSDGDLLGPVFRPPLLLPALLSGTRTSRSRVLLSRFILGRSGSDGLLAVGDASSSFDGTMTASSSSLIDCMP